MFFPKEIVLFSNEIRIDLALHFNVKLEALIKNIES